MNELTAKQLEYLLFFATMRGRERYVSEASEHFEVSKPTVSSICDKLQRVGMVAKNYSGELHLTELGKQEVEEKLALQQDLKRWLHTELGLLPLTAEKEARTMVTILRIETMEAMLDSIQRPKPRLPEKIAPPQIEEKKVIDFHINKVDGDGPSMGDKGFEKPAVLIVHEGEAWILLKAAKIEYKPQQQEYRKTPMVGSLDTLWYEYNNRWYEVSMREDSTYAIPFSVIEVMKMGDSSVGTLKIRARASVGMMKMPESEAMMLFDFNGIEIK